MRLTLKDLLNRRTHHHLRPWQARLSARGITPSILILGGWLALGAGVSLGLAAVWHPLIALAVFFGLCAIGGVVMLSTHLGFERVTEKTREQTMLLIDKCFDQHPNLIEVLEPFYENLVEGVLDQSYVANVQEELQTLVETNNNQGNLEKKVGEKFQAWRHGQQTIGVAEYSMAVEHAAVKDIEPVEQKQ